MMSEVPDPKRMGYKGLTSEDRFWTKVNKTPHCWEWNGTKLASGYGVFGVAPKAFRAHRVSYMWANGPIPDDLFIDHICRNKVCVRPDHLRLVTNKQNQENRGGIGSRSKSGHRGVFWDSNRRKWGTLVAHHGKRYRAGHYDDIEEANAAVIALRNDLYTHNTLDRSAPRHPKPTNPTCPQHGPESVNQ